MILITVVIAAVVAAWLLLTFVHARRQKITLRQALLYAPLALIWRIDAGALSKTAADDGPLLYVVSHQSRLDPALMLCLLPENTLHILDDHAASSPWLEPWRDLARTIAFNPEHVFVSRRLVRVLRGRGRLCVYLAADMDPASRAFRLYRAVARIALRAEAKVVPIRVDGAEKLTSSFVDEAKTSQPFARLTIRTLAPATLLELRQRNPEITTNSSALFARMEELRQRPPGPND
ncbi:1-acyl-sn-glycerol-3-phosphate acyltransferase [Aquamicrobium zhengzhouense]|uniref:1-acyl-sn-glycerol-3-phosphate acyltransferase n=1 Tax=Aquamicrobium zhengzhouense TaxID=2781738 RepID=A0ABS0SAD6_9HYPH|nr:1-acyl-sn-glycerol-3-phosphate acyltransferase [Aquamicrobium zhengzhouense]MBI1620250.1 1-acyl-sn-glycerol-3-phosphate acyltransferase [Aquamicrobium zhengzhouense]